MNKTLWFRLPLLMLSLTAGWTLTSCGGSGGGSSAGPMTIDGTFPQRGAPGQTFTIIGRNFGANQGTKIPSINRCDGNRLEVVRWSDEAIVVAIPDAMPYTGLHKVIIYAGAAGSRSSTSVDFWVTAAPVPEYVTNRYEIQVRSFAAAYRRSDEWIDWMLEHRSRWEPAFERTLAAPCEFTIAYSYERDPIDFDPPWTSEREHMAVLEDMATALFPNHRFRFLFEADPADTWGRMIIPPANESRAAGNTVWTYYEGIFGHEWAHVLGIAHHYPGNDYGGGLFMPPGETTCTMDRSSPGSFCSAGRTALGIPLDIDTAGASRPFANALRNRYPSDY